MKTGRGAGEPAGGMKFVAANRAAVLQAAAGAVVLLLLALAWVALGDAPRPAQAEPPQAQTRPAAVPEAAPKAISQSASGTVSSDSSPTSPSAPVPSAEVAPAASAAPAPSATASAQPVSPPVTSSPAAVAQAPAVPTAVAAATQAAAQGGGADKATAVPPPVCEPAPQDASCTGVKRFPPAPPGNGFMVEVGIFTDAEKAETLRRELALHGQSAYLQSRVLLGPFPDRKSAQQAEEKIRRERKLGGMILPPHKP